MAKTIPNSSKSKTAKDKEPFFTDNHDRKSIRIRLPRLEDSSTTPKFVTDVKTKKVVLDLPDNKPAPVNARLIEDAANYPARIQSTLLNKTKSFSDFILDEIAPSLLSMYNGQQDAIEILQRALGVSPQLSEFTVMADRILWNSLKIQTVRKVAKSLSLSKEDETIVLLQALDLPTSTVEHMVKSILAADRIHQREIQEKSATRKPVKVKSTNKESL